MSANDTRIHIAGSGAIAGGVYADVHVSGSGRVTSPLESETIRVSGTLTAEAPVKAGSIRVSGAATLADEVEAGTIGVSGTLSCGGGVTVDKLNIAGTLEVAQRLIGGTVEIAGALSVGGDCEVERFKSRGGFEVQGLLSADEIDARMYGRCSAREIGGEHIEIRMAKRPLYKMAAVLGIVNRTALEADTVEGDRVYLENAKVRTVRGREIVLGDECEIDLVEYSGELKQAAGAKVKTARKAEAAATAQG